MNLTNRQYLTSTNPTIKTINGLFKTNKSANNTLAGNGYFDIMELI